MEKNKLPIYFNRVFPIFKKSNPIKYDEWNIKKIPYGKESKVIYQNQLYTALGDQNSTIPGKFIDNILFVFIFLIFSLFFINLIEFLFLSFCFNFLSF
jgi:hypothetical protein